MAEREGFEPSVQLPVRRISSAVLSTTQPPLRRGHVQTPASARPLEGRRLAEGRCECKRALAIIEGDTRFRRMNISSSGPFGIEPPSVSHARFGIGEVVRHRIFPFRGVVFDIDPVFANSEEWYESIPEEIRPAKDQPFYHLLAENGETSYVAYVSQQNLLPDDEEGPVDHPEVRQMFSEFRDGRYVLKRELRH